MSALDPAPAFDDDNASLFAALGLLAVAQAVLEGAHRAARAPADVSPDEDDAVMLAALGAIRLATKLQGALASWGVDPAEPVTDAAAVPAEPGALLR
ncbi:MAG: hypothetical protein U0325_21405 [Polyangiales bacterium]